VGQLVACSGWAQSGGFCWPVGVFKGDVRVHENSMTDAKA